MIPPLRPSRGGVLLAVRVTAKSSRDEVTGLHAGAGGAVSLAVKVTAPPDKGKANQSVIAVLAEAAACPSRLSAWFRARPTATKRYWSLAIRHGLRH